tara:strand:- start:4916 stop:6634 length:1719 start_codon:yes stop_codon:yes gene_type:complete
MRKLNLYLVLVFLISLIMYVQAQEFDTKDPKTWEGVKDWSQITQEQILKTDQIFLHKASIEQAESYFKDKLVFARDLNNKEMILYVKLYPNLDDTLVNQFVKASVTSKGLLIKGKDGKEIFIVPSKDTKNKLSADENGFLLVKGKFIFTESATEVTTSKLTKVGNCDNPLLSCVQEIEKTLTVKAKDSAKIEVLTNDGFYEEVNVDKILQGDSSEAILTFNRLDGTQTKFFIQANPVITQNLKKPFETKINILQIGSDGKEHSVKIDIGKGFEYCSNPCTIRGKLHTFTSGGRVNIIGANGKPIFYRGKKEWTIKEAEKIFKELPKGYILNYRGAKIAPIKTNKELFRVYLDGQLYKKPNGESLHTKEDIEDIRGQAKEFKFKVETEASILIRNWIVKDYKGVRQENIKSGTEFFTEEEAKKSQKIINRFLKNLRIKGEATIERLGDREDKSELPKQEKAGQNAIDEKLEKSPLGRIQGSIYAQQIGEARYDITEVSKGIRNRFQGTIKSTITMETRHNNKIYRTTVTGKADCSKYYMLDQCKDLASLAAQVLGRVDLLRQIKRDKLKANID